MAHPLSFPYRRPDPSDHGPPAESLLFADAVDAAGATTIAVLGELDVLTVRILEHHIARAVARRRSTLVIDLGGVTFMGAAGVNALVRARAATRRAGIALHLRHASPAVVRLLRMAGLA